MGSFVTAFLHVAMLNLILHMQLPAAWQSRADISSVLVRAKPLRDADGVHEHCSRCRTPIPLFSAQGDVCPSCGNETIRCFATFAALPLVEFELGPGIDEATAQALLSVESTTPQRWCACLRFSLFWATCTATPRVVVPGFACPDAGACFMCNKAGLSICHGGWVLITDCDCRRIGAMAQDMAGTEMLEAGADVLLMDDEQSAPASATADCPDPFGTQLGMSHTRIVADRAALEQLSLAEVVVRRWKNPHVPPQFFRIMDPNVDVVVGSCGHFFEAAEYEILSLTSGARPFSRDPLPGHIGKQ